jgi:UDP-N-acetylmuramoylalanine--D-glutamate ligase
VSGGAVELLNNKRFLVMGMGKSGKAVARLLALKGFAVVVTDDDPAVVSSALTGPELAGLANRVDAVPVDTAVRTLAGCGAVIASPGVPMDHPLIRASRENRVTVTGEVEVAFGYCSSPIIGVTGTNGKSTVVNVLGRIFEAAGKKTVVAGNIGTPFSSVVESGESYDMVVLEISSFQLDTIIDFRTDVAVLLNVTADHLDRYDDSFELYAKSKARILNRARSNTLFVYNADDPVCVRIAEGFSGDKLPFSSSRALDEGVSYEHGEIILRRHGIVEPVIKRDGFPPIGVHNLENAMASVAAVTPFDIDLGHIRRALRDYTALPHRMEIVRKVGGITYINDSKATNVDATIKSLRSIEEKVVLILGGSDKNLDFHPLLDHLHRVKEVILIGQTREKIRSVLVGCCEISDAGTLEEAVRRAAAVASPGDTVLLAPACASFDMFSNYAHRGEVFRRAVQAL